MQKIWTLPHAGQQSNYGRGKAELGAVSAVLYGVRFDRLIFVFRVRIELLIFCAVFSPSIRSSGSIYTHSYAVNGLVMRFSGLL